MFILLVYYWICRAKIICFLLLSLFCINSNRAQELCDSSYKLCDSLTIDSILITHNPNTGDLIHFLITAHHQFLHGPIISICPENDSIDFVNNQLLFSGIAGPTHVNSYQEFMDLAKLGNTITGHHIVNNTNNSFSNCNLPFSFPIPEETTRINSPDMANEVTIYPNPAHDELTIS